MILQNFFPDNVKIRNIIEIKLKNDTNVIERKKKTLKIKL